MGRSTTLVSTIVAPMMTGCVGNAFYLDGEYRGEKCTIILARAMVRCLLVRGSPINNNNMIPICARYCINYPVRLKV